MQSTESFPLFPNLPTELRDKIWLHTIDLRSHVLPRPPITELAVCHEARNVLLKVYRPCFRPVPQYREDDTGFGVMSKPGERWLEIQGMGKRSPRSPYANYETDVLYLAWAILYPIHQEEASLQKYFFQEAIDHVQHVFIRLNAWTPRGPRRRMVGPPVTKPDPRQPLLSFGSLKTLSLAEEPKLRVSIPPLNDDQLQKQRESRFHRMPDDEVLEREKLVLRARFAEGKILTPILDPTSFTNPYLKFDQARQWINRKAEELPNWNAPEVQYATIIADPEG
ncbi:uncharacterized protein LY89DRAFT_689835 [Mollisia scopiformis]|uniref:2EXR domain-containing protein n=1 Tax=Mollisia scopiformis TaxID=149040 RepID=A0A132BC38_MOLSC|nr:uncharacterized protein LY89DRAFT_689835 [Mollisia scopiformis]KUJ09941.1 hypothetical protein LY89DRAFT_689835 [Mollisia scopiformis]